MNSIANTVLNGEWAPADWSQFFPDTVSALVAGAFVGAGVGFALYRWQKWSDGRNLKRRAQQQWRLAAPRLALAMRYDYQRSDSSHVLVANAAPFQAIVNVTESMDLVAWSSDDSSNGELEIATRLAGNSTTLVRLAAELADLSYIKWKQYFGAENANQDGFVGAVSQLVLEGKASAQFESFEQGARKISSDPEFAKQASDYQAWLDQCSTDHLALRTALRSNDSAPQRG